MVHRTLVYAADSLGNSIHPISLDQSSGSNKWLSNDYNQFPQQPFWHKDEHRCYHINWGSVTKQNLCLPTISKWLLWEGSGRPSPADLPRLVETFLAWLCADLHSPAGITLWHRLHIPQAVSNCQRHIMALSHLCYSHTGWKLRWCWLINKVLNSNSSGGSAENLQSSVRVWKQLQWTLEPRNLVTLSSRLLEAQELTGAGG